jgi:hypothetical protein
MDLEKELQSLYDELAATNLRPYITSKQCQALAILMDKCINNKKRRRDIRIHALNRIAGAALADVAGVYNIESTKNLTGTMATRLIDLFLEDKTTWEPSFYARQLIGALESEFETFIEAGESTTDTARMAT